MTRQVERSRAEARKEIRDFVLLPMAAGAALMAATTGLVALLVKVFG